MPQITPEQLDELKQKVRHEVVRSLRTALNTLLEALPAERPKHNQVIKLLARENSITEFEIGNRLSFEQLEMLRNELRADLLLFVDRLVLLDFSEQAPPRPELKPGHLLYKIPATMRVRESSECIVRIAHTLTQLLHDLVPDENTTIEDMPVAEVMEVEIVDLNFDEPAFDIMLVSTPEQYVDEFSCTEWVFYVRPLLAGEHQLAIKVSVIITIAGKERTKEVLLRRTINVSSEATDLAPATLQKPYLIKEYNSTRAGGGEYAPPPMMHVPDVMPAPSQVPPSRTSAPSAPVPPKRKRSRMKVLSMAATVLLLVVAVFLFLPRGQESYPTDEGVTNEPDTNVPDKGVPRDTLPVKRDSL